MKLKTRKTSDFFGSEYCNWGSYDNLRKIASLVDGQKNASRKILWYSQQKNLKNEIKVSQLNSKVAESEEYLHGDMSSVIVNLAQDYPGTNNINLMMPEGGFGTRIKPEASAPRYIYTYGSPEFFKIFSKDDTEILEHQDFEGHRIEPKFMLPKLPMLLINGAEGISSGFAQKILPRNPDELEKYLRYFLNNPTAPRKPFQNKPFYRGYRGTIHQGETKNQWIIQGTFKREANKVIISEIPIGYSLKTYIKVLDKLEDDKKIIGYKDNSVDDFEFVVQFNRKYLDALSDTQIISLLKLTKKVSENYTVMTEKNTVQNFDNINDIFWRYYDVKMQYLQKRKDYMIGNITQDIRELISKYIFIKSIVDETLIISKRDTADIITDLDNIDKIIKVENTYDYLLNMSIRSLTKERMEKLMGQIKDQKSALDVVKISTLNEMWLTELN